VVFTAIIISPDIVYAGLYPYMTNNWFPELLNTSDMLWIFLFSFIVLMAKSIWVRFLFLSIAMLFTLCELAYYTYFGTIMSPYVILLFFTQMADVAEAFIELMRYVYIPFVLIFIIATPVLITLLKFDEKLEGNTLRYKHAGKLLLILLLSFPAVVFFSKDTSPFQPFLYSHSVKNFFSSIALLAGKELPRAFGLDIEKISFEPYKVMRYTFEPPKQNIILIMGESLGYPRMSLFGYELDTTPNLKKLQKNDGLIARKALSGGVQTDVSIPTFFSLKREPKNSDLLLKPENNLLNMAKNMGYKVHYISVQNSGYIGKQVASYADVVMDNKSFEEKLGTKDYYDEVLVEYLKSVDLSIPNFIVLNQRNSHFPYEKNTPEKFRKFSYDKKDFDDYNIKTYASALLYTDYIYSEVIKYLKNYSPLPAMFFATSDHGEMMGENGRWGHSQLIFDAAKVPFLFWHKGGDMETIEDISEARDGITHYEIGKLVAYALGYFVFNPNEDGDFYINGIDINGRGGYITVDTTKIRKDL